MRSKLPIIHQTEATECGLACLVMIANYHGHQLDLAAVRRDHAASLKGATLDSIINLAGAFDLGSRALACELDDLAKLQCPAILHWDMNHFVVLKSVKRGRVHIHDPGRGLQVLPLKTASKHFTGVALELTPHDSFSPQRQKLSVHIHSLWSRSSGIKRAIFQTLLLSLILQAAVLSAPFYLQFVVDGVLPSKDQDLLIALALGFGGLIAIRASAEAARSWAILVYGHQLSFQLIGNVFAHLMRLPTSYFEKRHIGDIISRMGSTQPIQTALTQSVVAVIIDGFMAAVTLCVMFGFSPPLALVVLTSVAIMLCITLLIYPKIRAAQEDSILTRAAENSHVIESIRASTTLKLFGREAARESDWRNLYALYVNAATRYGAWGIWQNFAQKLLLGLQGVAVIFLGARLVMSGSLSLGGLFAFSAFALSFSASAAQLLQKGIQFRLLTLHIERLSDIVHAAPEDAHGTLRPNIKGEITLESISFRYSESDPWVLRDVNLTLTAGDMVAFHGKSGGGKTTLLKLILGLYTPTQGRILIDGIPLSQLNLAYWRSKIGVVMQDDLLLSGSLIDNISIFDTQFKIENVVKAAKSARIHDDIVAMPMGYESRVGDMGSSLSGGQRQRILLARALYQNPTILCLDEGTANLDAQTEREIADVISTLPITRIIVAHRPEFINRADQHVRVTTTHSK